MGLPSVGMASNAGPMKVVKAARVLRPLKLVSGVPSKRFFCFIIREVKQNLLSNVPAADSHPNHFGISPSYWKNLFLTGCATSWAV